MSIARYVVLSVLFALLTPLIAHAGDYPWWTITRDSKTWGIGEMDNRILLYLGENYWIAPFPGILPILLGFAFLGLIVTTVSCIRPRSRA